MPARVTVDFSEVKALFQRLLAVVKNPRPALEDLAQRLLLTSRQSFESQASPEGQPWRQLSPSYAVWKAQSGRGGQGILRFQGALLRTLHSGVEQNVVFVGSPLPYSAAHQFGHTFPAMTVRATRAKALRWFGAGGQAIFARSAKIPARTLPARPYLPAPETAERIGVETLEEHLKAAAEGK